MLDYRELELIKNKINDEVNETIIHSVIPIFKGKTELHIEQIGTGFYISYRDHLYVITANHVFKDDFNVLYPNSASTLGTIPYKNPFSSENVDLAVYPLETPLEYIFTPYKLSEELIGNFDSGYFFCCGYPETQCKSYNKQIRNAFKTFISKYENNPNNNVFQVDARFEIPITFNRKEILTCNGEKSVFPYPNGMSGGPLFSFSLDENKQFNYKLAGLLTRYDANNEKTMVATNIRFMQLMLKKMEL